MSPLKELDIHIDSTILEPTGTANAETSRRGYINIMKTPNNPDGSGLTSTNIQLLDPNTNVLGNFDIWSPPVTAQAATASFDVIRMDQQLRHQREQERGREHADERMDHNRNRINQVACLPSDFSNDPFNVEKQSLGLRPHRTRTPFLQISCAVCAQQSMATPPQNSSSSIGVAHQCSCRRQQPGELVEQYAPLLMPTTSSVIHPPRDAFLSGNMDHPSIPLVLHIDSDIEDCDRGEERPKRFVLQPKMPRGAYTRSKSESPTGTRCSEEGMFRPDHETDFVRRRHQHNNQQQEEHVDDAPRPLRRPIRRASASIMTTMVTSARLPMFPFETPENRPRPICPLLLGIGEAPFDVPMQVCTPEDSADTNGN